MKVGLVTPLPPPLPAKPIDPAPLAAAAERLGFESFWAQEHTIAPVQVVSTSRVFGDGQVPGFTDPIVVLSRCSAVTTRIKLGTATLLPAEHNPLVLAKALATLDLLSGGRVLVGVGAGWLREEAEIMGVDFDHRWTQVKESMQVVKALWTEDEAEFHGRYYDFPAVRSLPKPLQSPHPPVLLGGTAKNVLQRVVAWGDGWIPHWVSIEEVAEARIRLDEMAAAAGRDPAAITISVYSDEQDIHTVSRLHEAGAHRVVVRLPVVHSVAEAEDAAARLAEKLIVAES
jgi:probable F420-dependent oxidoreductase